VNLTISSVGFLPPKISGGSGPVQSSIFVSADLQALLTACVCFCAALFDTKSNQAFPKKAFSVLRSCAQWLELLAGETGRKRRVVAHWPSALFLSVRKTPVTSCVLRHASL
jgi:hypothetical protein